MREARSLWVLVAALSTTACEKCAPGQVANGVARLSVRNFGAIVEIIANDDHCGFQSPAVVGTASVASAAGGMGQATWSIEGCTIDLERAPHTVVDCNQVSTIAKGRLKVSAKKTITGTPTGDPMDPIAPGGPAAVTIEVTRAELDGFVVQATDSDAILTQISGSLSGRAQPILAADAEVG